MTHEMLQILCQKRCHQFRMVHHILITIKTIRPLNNQRGVRLRRVARHLSDIGHTAPLVAFSLNI